MLASADVNASGCLDLCDCSSGLAVHEVGGRVDAAASASRSALSWMKRLLFVFAALCPREDQVWGGASKSHAPCCR